MCFVLLHFSVVTTASQQSFNSQINSTSKPISVAAPTTTATPVESTKHSVRPHQILSRETSFVSKPPINVSEEKKDEQQSATNATAIATVKIAPQSSETVGPSPITTAITTASTVTITSKSINCY